MAKQRTISIVGAGSLGTALTVRLREAGYGIKEIVWRGGSDRRRRAQEQLAQAAGAKLVLLEQAALAADVLWLAVPDDAIASCAHAIAMRGFKSPVVLHSSGALTSDELKPLRQKGAAVAAVHPLMSFVAGEPPVLRDVLFSLEGDRTAVALAKRIVRGLEGVPFTIAKKHKPLYHAFGAFTSPLLMAHFAAAEAVAEKAGVPPREARRAMRPIVMRTLQNYFKGGAAKAFSGPLVRGDVETVRKHLSALKGTPRERNLYLALVQEALERLPVAEKRRIGQLVR